MTPEQAEKQFLDAKDAFNESYVVLVAAEDAREAARRAMLEAEDRLYAARNQSVACPACGAPAGRRCTLERDRTVKEDDPGILHTVRVVAANRKVAT